MNEDIKKRVIENFYEMDKNPRPSYYQDEVSAFMVKFGEGLGLSTIVDETKNVVIFKPAQSLNNAGTPVNVDTPVFLQAHMDLVFDIKMRDESDPKKYDPTKNPVIPQICDDENLMRGMGTKYDCVKKEFVLDENIETSLGADDGIGAAIIMAILQDKTIPHPPIVAIFTTDEEVGMLGALKMNRDFIYSSVNINTKMKWDKASFINVDEETYDKLCYGCAGGVGANLELKYEVNKDFDSESWLTYEISVSGLIGGHSGVEIHKRRANAHRLMGRVMQYVQAEGKDGKASIDFELFEINGGAADNAIAKESTAIVAICGCNKEDFENAIVTIENVLLKEYKDIENMEETEKHDKMSIKCKTIEKRKDFPMRKEDKNNLVSMLYLIPNDVLGFYMYEEVSENGTPEEISVVETSSNMGILKTENNCVRISCAVRSFFDSRRDFVYSQMEMLAGILKFDIEQYNPYPGWTQKGDSTLNKYFKESFAEAGVPSKEIKGRIIHAGLENGAFAGILGDIDMIACGPTIENVHTINERLHLDTVDYTVDILLGVLDRLAKNKSCCG